MSEIRITETGFIRVTRTLRPGGPRAGWRAAITCRRSARRAERMKVLSGLRSRRVFRAHVGVEQPDVRDQGPGAVGNMGYGAASWLRSSALQCAPVRSGGAHCCLGSDGHKSPALAIGRKTVYERGAFEPVKYFGHSLGTIWTQESPGIAGLTCNSLILWRARRDSNP